MTKLERLLRGDKATYEAYDITKVVDLRPYLEGDGSAIMICYNNEYLWLDNECENSCWGDITFLLPEKPRTIEDGLKEGDIIESSNDNVHKVLGVCGDAIFLSKVNSFIIADPYVYSLQLIINQGYKLKTEQPKDEIVELTIQDIADGKGKGVDPKLIRIKE